MVAFHSIGLTFADEFWKSFLAGPQWPLHYPRNISFHASSSSSSGFSILTFGPYFTSLGLNHISPHGIAYFRHIDLSFSIAQNHNLLERETQRQHRRCAQQLKNANPCGQIWFALWGRILKNTFFVLSFGCLPVGIQETSVQMSSSRTCEKYALMISESFKKTF